MNPHTKAELVMDALRMAWIRWRPEAGLIFQSDGGSQYGGDDFQAELKSYGMRMSLSRKDN